MSYKDAIQKIQQGFAVSRLAWRNKFIFIDQSSELRLPENVIPLFEKAKTVSVISKVMMATVDSEGITVEGYCPTVSDTIVSDFFVIEN